MELIITLISFVLLMSLGFFVGGHVERRHFRLLDEREGANGDFLITQLKSYPWAVSGPSPPTLLCGEAVIASDYLKTFLAGLRKIFGGEMRSYQSLLIRARREALQRLIEEAKVQGYNAVCNVRYYSTDIAGASKRRSKVVMVTLLVTGTAYHCRAPQVA
jgi:uncharacterized protein YbjQ (UPF0145 family)